MSDGNQERHTMSKTFTIKIRKQDRASGKSIETMTNGLRETLAVDQEITVAEHTLETLRNSDILFDVVGEDGVSSSTAPLTDTATRDTPNVDPLVTGDGGEPRQVPELGANGAPGVAGAVAPNEEYSSRLAAENADGQGTAAGGEQADVLTDTASRGTPTENGDADKTDEGSPALKTLDSLKHHLEGEVSKEDAQALLDEEKAGKNRTGAVEALEKHIAADTPKGE